MECVLAGRRFEIETADADAHLDRLVEQGGEERMIPYWADLWPSALALGEWMLGNRTSLAGRATLDLGCGLGLSGIAAAAAGAKPVYLADLHTEATDLAMRNAARCRVATACRPLPLDWSRDAPPAHLSLVIAADILFERSEHEPLECFLAERIPTGVPIILADPIRTPSKEFLARPLASRMLHPFGRWRVRLGDHDHTIHFFANDSAIESFPPPPELPPIPSPAHPDRVSP